MQRTRMQRARVQQTRMQQTRSGRGPLARPRAHPALRLAAIAIAIGLGVACGSDRAPYESGLVDGGALSEPEKARRHFAAPVRPPSGAAASFAQQEAAETDEGILRTLVTFSRTYEIDRIYQSMQGPRSTIRVPLGDPSAEPELLWIKGVHVEVVGPSGEPASQEFMCHVVARVGALDERNEALGLSAVDDRFATLSQGTFHKEYPKGFGLPVLSTHHLLFASQVLNINIEDPDLRVRHKIVTHYIRDRELAIPMKAIASTYAQVMMLIEGEEGEGYFGVGTPDPEIHGESCAVGRTADSLRPSLRLMDDGHRRFTAHWVLEPGKSTNQSLATNLLSIREDTTVHAIDVHLHPFAEWVELRDLTSQETVFRSEARQADEGIGLASVQTYRSEEGIPIYKDRHYAIISAYDNTSGVEQNAMAVMYLGLHDPAFDPSLLGDPAARAAHRQELEAARVEDLRAAVRSDPGDAVAHFRLAAALHKADRFEEAADHLRTAVQLKPEDDRIRSALAATLEAAREQQPN